MIYKQTVAEMRTAAQAINPNGRFDHGRVVDLSQKFEGDYPLIWLYPWVLQDPANRDFLYTHPLVIAFYELDAPGSSNAEREDLIHRMEVLKDAFISKLRELYKKNDIRNVRSEPLYQMHNQTVSGYAVSFTYLNSGPCV